MKKEPKIVTYEPVILGDTKVTLPVMEMTGLGKTKYLVVPDEYFDIEQHVLLGGVTLVPMRNQFDETI